MTKNILATLNIQWCGDPVHSGATDRRAQLVGAIQQLTADTVVLTEYKAGPAGEALQSLLHQQGYSHFYAPSDMPPYKLGCAVASRNPIVKISPASKPPFDPWRVVAFSYCGMNVYGLYVPASAPAIYTFWDWLRALAPLLVDQPILLLGDFNTGVSNEDSVAYQFGAHDHFVALKAMGFVDVWRQQHPDVRDFTWYSSAGNGFKLDHVLASPIAAHAVLETWLDHAPRLSGATDHSAMVLSLNSIV